MILTAIAEAAPPRPRAPQAAPLVSSLPAWLASAGDIEGELAGVQVSGRTLGHIVRHLENERVDFYYPRERVVRSSGARRDAHDRSFIPGCFFLGRGVPGRDALREYADYFGWRYRFLVPAGQAAQAVLRKEVAALGALLCHDPTLRAWQGLRGGDRCRVACGAFMGQEGFVEYAGERARLWVRLTIFGRSTSVEVPVEYLERI
jgi:hypothetical protein